MHKDLIRRLRALALPTGGGADHYLHKAAREAADALEAMQADIHSRHPNCTRAGCVNERLRVEVDAMKAIQAVSGAADPVGIPAGEQTGPVSAAPTLTDEQIDAIARTCQNNDGTVVYLLLARAIERAIRSTTCTKT